MKRAVKILTYGSLGALFLLLAGVISQIRSPEPPKVRIGLVEFTVEIADEPAEWRKGLVDHRPLKQGEGLLFVFPTANRQTFWMKDMTFPIDIIWIRNNEVVGFTDDAQPDNGEVLYYSPGPVDYVLETAAGERRRLGITVNAPFRIE